MAPGRGQQWVVLSEENVSEFHERGYVVLRGLFSSSEVERLRGEVDEALSSAFGKDYGRNTRTEELGEGEIAAEGNFLPLMADRSPLSMALVADDPRLLPAADALLGTAAVPVSPALATCMVSDTPWHNDSGTGERWVRFNAYLDPVDEATGALRIAVRSQNLPAADSPCSFDPTEASAEIAVLQTEPGDVIAFDPRAFHASFGGTRRLRWCVDYAAVPPTRDSVRAEATRGLIQELSSWPHPPDWPVWRSWAACVSSSRGREAMTTLRKLGVGLDE